jgi:peptide deformylase
MTLLPLVKYPDPLLRETCTKVETFDSSLAKLVDDMFETMYRSDGVGLAAPQIGSLQSVTVVNVTGEKADEIALINPRIVEFSGAVPSEEGCLSIPGYRGIVKRHERIIVEAQDLQGNAFTIETDDFLAICLQHEIDHLNGILFTDHLSRLKKGFFNRWFEKHEPL